tara:strand:- start:584 stop:913 length:330 start_codon:yes stop_codon:yes gene_type:complete
MNLKELTLNYFKTFSSQDPDGLRGLFSNDVYLRDWEINVEGIDGVVAANKGIFDSVDTINVVPVKICETGNMTISEIEVHVNSTEVLKVVDVIEFDSEGKIVAVRAYKG